MSAYSDAVLATANLTHDWKLDETSGTSAADAVGSHPLTYAAGFTLGAPGLYHGGITAVTFARATAGRGRR